MANPATAAQGLRKSSRDKVVLDGLDLAVPTGTIFALPGPNGVGKTIAVRTLSALVSHDAVSGEIRVSRLGSGTADLYATRGKSEVSVLEAPPSGRTRTPRPPQRATTSSNPPTGQSEGQGQLRQRQRRSRRHTVAPTPGIPCPLSGPAPPGNMAI
ncbi:ATP-binding cassette domain-containing protein [Streptomyces sp. NPDC002573]|uniref:ATP-binding cassette domain-containing protein n=1 Tax=Streptomyces sp. NPDC002573 TaxID=3364651 RepID=UPI00369CBD2F